MAVGERFLKMGHYYKAADAFELAYVWDRHNHLLVLARSHALFAAGEYMSSAYYLGQALQNDPNLIQCRIDWGALLDSRDTFDAQMVELLTWQQRSNSAELAFLMGYVLFMDDKLTRAQISAEYALDYMKDHAGARILAEAVKKALNPDQAVPPAVPPADQPAEQSAVQPVIQSMEEPAAQPADSDSQGNP
jgi:tetratricopeptide (TPR) repeat protein